MNSMKRLGMAAVLVVGVMLPASTPAQAAPKRSAPHWAVELTNVGDEPRTSGEATLTEVLLVGTISDSPWGYWDCYTGTLNVQCSHLTPGATYCISEGGWFPTPVASVTANSRGKVQVSADVYFEIGYALAWEWPWDWELAVPYVVEVVRLNPDGSSTTVLTGEMVPPFGW